MKSRELNVDLLRHLHFKSYHSKLKAFFFSISTNETIIIAGDKLFVIRNASHNHNHASELQICEFEHTIPNTIDFLHKNNHTKYDK